MTRKRVDTLATGSEASVSGTNGADVIPFPWPKEYRPPIEKECRYCGLKHTYFFCPRGCDLDGAA